MAINAAAFGSDVFQFEPSRIAPYSPTKVLPVFGLIELVNRCTPARRQNVVPPGYMLTRGWIDWSGTIFRAPAGHVMEAWGPTLLPTAV
jgi:hypothetical protein